MAERTGAADPGGGGPDARGTLYVVATPIGNLGDITLRALEVLRSVALVAAEDTRMTRRLWARHEISTRLVSYHARNAARREPELLEQLDRGLDLALVTDAGTPLVSDPGEGLVARWAAAGGRVVPVPGPSAVLAALVASGIPAPRWTFEGFLPRSGRERRERLARIAGDERATVLFEAPGRAAAMLRDLAAVCGAARPAALCRELTKLHEEIRRGSLGELASGAEQDPPRGEVTLVVAGRAARAGEGRDAAAGAGGADRPRRAVPEVIVQARLRVGVLVATGLTRSEAARRVAAETGLPRRELFRPVALPPSGESALPPAPPGGPQEPPEEGPADGA
ncbi:MAG: 16S rRNA (cytidine(1402)-2'-O)-methyltransferase [Candidatus Limnocylindrales bacterium]